MLSHSIYCYRLWADGNGGEDDGTDDGKDDDDCLTDREGNK